MSAPSAASPVNGHASPMVDDRTATPAHGDPTDSDLSDVQAADEVEVPSPESPEAQDPVVPKPELNHDDTYDSGEDDDASADADFDMADSPQSAQNESENDRPSSSNGSRQASKRKGTTGNEDEYMRENPELYGLRRSVRQVSFLHFRYPYRRELTIPPI